MSFNTNYHVSLHSLYHYIMGKCCAMTDNDLTLTTEGILEESTMEYLRTNNNRKPVALIDYKYIDQKNVGKQYFGDVLDNGKPIEAIHAQAEIADYEYKEPLPFFVALTYLDWDIPQYYIIPVNIAAKSMFNSYSFNLDGKWLSVKTFSQFLHNLRKLPWNPNETIKLKDVNKLNEHTPYNVSATTLGTLSNKINKNYMLPMLNYTTYKGRS